MKTNTLAKLQTISGYISTLLLIMVILVSIAIIALILAVIICYSSDAMLEEVLTELESNNIGDLAAIVVIAILNLIVVGISLFLMYKIFSDIKTSYTPFKAENVRRLKNISYLILGSSVALPVVCWAIISTTELNPDVWVVFNPVMFAIAILFYCISLIFAYGTELQQESDETL